MQLSIIGRLYLSLCQSGWVGTIIVRIPNQNGQFWELQSQMPMWGRMFCIMWIASEKRRKIVNQNWINYGGKNNNFCFVWSRIQMTICKGLDKPALADPEKQKNKQTRFTCYITGMLDFPSEMINCRRLIDYCKLSYQNSRGRGLQTTF